MDEEIKVNFESVCNELNIDEVAKERAWKEYQDINNDYVLEVSKKRQHLVGIKECLYSYRDLK